ncbi:MAG: hypothetical protein VX646_02500 [Verrucomicrobiota bacterium]|jgi:hypothetical protein|nr:hypothetical protein [Verrucomicrobiota bacterium]MEE2966726.1 hypothetical protein [Verrucomicrobiota bacterium]|tara:strand:+ start:190 stop:396 length:207 start_codon:yes stop_codon:yes gene_type:complete
MNGMKIGILLASPTLRSRLRRKRINDAFMQYDQLSLTAQDKGYLELAKKVLSSDNYDLQKPSDRRLSK